MDYQDQLNDQKCQLTMLEMDALFRFTTSCSNTTDRIRIGKAITCSNTENSLIEMLHEIHKSKEFQPFQDSMVNVPMKLQDIIKALYDREHQILAERLYCCYLECQRNISILRMNRAQTENRRKISQYFKNIKKLVHEIAFKNPHADVKRLGDIMKHNIESATDHVRKMFLCDKYTALKAAEMDALINITGTVSPEHEGYSEMESFITSTSNPSLSQVILYGRKADVMSTFSRFEEGEDLLRAAYVSADFSAPCVEITDMIYKNVVFKLSKFEKNPLPDLQKSLIFEASRGMWSLNVEAEDLRIFWKRLFLLRIVFCLLGLGKFCDTIQNYVPTQESIEEAERIISCDELTNMEHRRMMFLYTALSRLNQWKGRYDDALHYVELARKFSREGKYFEDKALQKFEIDILSFKQTSDTESNSISLHQNNDDSSESFSFNRPIIYLPEDEIPEGYASFNSTAFSEELVSNDFRVKSND